MLKQNEMEGRWEVQGDGSGSHEPCKEATAAVISSNPINAGASQTFKVK